MTTGAHRQMSLPASDTRPARFPILEGGYWGGAYVGTTVNWLDFHCIEQSPSTVSRIDRPNDVNLAQVLELRRNSLDQTKGQGAAALE